MKKIGFFLLKFVSCIVFAVLLAAGSVWYLMRPTNYGGNLKIGEWTTDLATGSNAAGLYQRAQVALYGLWAMSSTETVYFVANVDADGSPLDSRCDYRVEGADPDARWWSLTIYRDFHFVPNADKVYSFSQTTIEREPNKSWRVYVSPVKQPKNWLPMGEEKGDFKLVFRAYNPSAAFVQQIADAKLPKVIKENCR